MGSAALDVEPRATPLRMVGPPGLNGPIVLCPVEGAFSSAAAPATASITTAKARRCRRETATFRSVTSALSRMAAGVTGHPGLPARSPVVLVLSHASVSATPQHLKWKAKIARVKVGKLKSVRNHHVRSMEAGDHGRPGILALPPVAVESKTVNVFAITRYPCMVAKAVWEMQRPARFATNKPVQLMDAFQIHALKEPSVQASQTALGNVENAPQDTLAMESPAKISMSVRRSPMPALNLTESTGVRTQCQATTACLAPHATLAHSRLVKDWRTLLPRNRSAPLVIPASMEATIAIRTLAATTWAISQTLCTAVSAGLALLEMD